MHVLVGDMRNIDRRDYGDGRRGVRGRGAVVLWVLVVCCAGELAGVVREDSVDSGHLWCLWCCVHDGGEDQFSLFSLNWYSYLERTQKVILVPCCCLLALVS